MTIKYIACESCEQLRDEVDALKQRQQELLGTIRQLAAEIPYPEEAGNAAVLIAEVGTLRAERDEAIRIRDHWSKMNEYHADGWRRARVELRVLRARQTMVLNEVLATWCPTLDGCDTVDREMHALIKTALRDLDKQ